ncbi:siderophore ABC transporter substrate-binding protein [Paenibacillus turpanensis]|uniref:siderophore ABC transporter substrate-binding protein n=1 Tax=Paenibacillus turpanensis TaxID=2689078 RepID=UPI00140DDF77|nr:siderophore ABC transporter substrate-binding protein [Paenibacillus turpanensis]
MKKKLSLLVLTLIVALVAAACGGTTEKTTETNNSATGKTESAAPAQPAAESKEITIKHKLGETKLKTNPKKVVVFDFGALDSLDKLGVEVTGVPQSNIPPYLKKFEDSKYQNVGSVVEPDFEKLAALQPDLILMSGRLSAKYEELSKLAPTVFIGLDTAKYMDSFTENMKTLGTIFGKEAEVEKELAAVNAEIKTVSEKIKATGKNALIVLANEGKLSAYGTGSRFGIIHDVLGFKPVDESIKVTTHGQSVSPEFVAEKNPDYLFVIDRNAVVTGEAAAKKTVENDLVKNTKAYKEGHIVYLDPNYWYLSGGGLVSVSEMVKQISAAVK